MTEKAISRGKNYTEREKLTLTALVDKYKSIIENKCTNAVYTLEKNKTWEKITMEFNSCAQEQRSTKQLQAAYNNLKRITRQSIANDNVKKYLAKKKETDIESFGEIEILPTSQEDLEIDQETKVLLKKFKKDEVADKKGIKDTGGGPYTPVLSEAGAQMLAIMGNQVKPLCNQYDSATEYYFDESSVCIEVVPDPPPLPPKKIVPKRTKLPARKRNITKGTIKMQYYRKKLECAMMEKKTRFVEYKSALKKQKLLDLEIKIKTTEYENIQKLSTCSN